MTTPRRHKPQADRDVKVDTAARRIGAGADDLRRLIVLASQRNHLVVRALKLGLLTEYAKNVCDAVVDIERQAYETQGACSTRDAAFRGAEAVRRNIVLQGPVSPDKRGRSV